MSTPFYLHILPETSLPDISELSPFRAVVIVDACVSPIWQANVSDWLVQSGWRMDSIKQCLFAPNGDDMALTTNEYKLLAGLMANPSQYFSKNEILRLLWGEQYSWRDYHGVEVLLSRLCNKALKQLNQPLPIQSVQAVGLVFTAEVTFA